MAPRTSSFPQADAVTLFARVLSGAKRSGPRGAGRVGVAGATRDTLKAKNDAYWANIVAIQHMPPKRGRCAPKARTTEGIAMLRQAADEEDATEKSPVTPGPIVPVRELLAELLIEAGQTFKAAITEFEKSMTREPGPPRSISGALRVSVAAKDTVRARIIRRRAW